MNIVNEGVGYSRFATYELIQSPDEDEPIK